MPTYLEKLQSEEWTEKRIEILERDKYTCQDCGETDISNTWYEGTNVKVHYEKSTKIYTTIFLDTGQPTEVILDNDEISIPILNVHHKKYIYKREPWEYDNEDLVTLCSECHKKRHEKEEILLYNEYGNIIRKIEKCRRCGGYGRIPKYSHVQGGICFACWGAGINLDYIEFNNRTV